MKRGIIVLIVSALVLITTGLWIFSTPGKFKPFDIVSFGIIIFVVGFALFVGYKRLSSAKRGEPTEDELSKKVLLRTAAMSYYISLYLWVAMLFIKDRVNLDTEEILGAGILGMALSFAICWLVFHFRGVRNE
jgi:peptidoglycan/LPS O-acetylase OafA/YrhL